MPDTNRRMWFGGVLDRGVSQWALVPTTWKRVRIWPHTLEGLDHVSMNDDEDDESEDEKQHPQTETSTTLRSLRSAPRARPCFNEPAKYLRLVPRSITRRTSRHRESKWPYGEEKSELGKPRWFSLKKESIYSNTPIGVDPNHLALCCALPEM